MNATLCWNQKVFKSSLLLVYQSLIGFLNELLRLRWGACHVLRCLYTTNGTAWKCCWCQDAAHSNILSFSFGLLSSRMHERWSNGLITLMSPLQNAHYIAKYTEVQVTICITCDSLDVKRFKNTRPLLAEAWVSNSSRNTSNRDI